MEEKNIEILMRDKCTREEAKHHLKKGTTIFEGDDLEKNLSEYLNEWEIPEEDQQEFFDMIEKKIPVVDWGIAEYAGKTYYIQYSL